MREPKPQIISKLELTKWLSFFCCIIALLVLIVLMYINSTYACYGPNLLIRLWIIFVLALVLRIVVS